MTFKDVQKVMQSQSPLFSDVFDQRTLNRLRVHGRGAFWYWDKKAHKERDMASKGDCCFNHIIGLPRKERAAPDEGQEKQETHNGIF